MSLDELPLPELRAKYRSELAINRYQLEKASQEQATLFEKWHTYCEKLSAQVAAEEDSLHRLKDRESLKLRSTPEKVLQTKYGLTQGQLKEGAINSIVNLKKEVIIRTKRLLRLKERHNVLKGAVKSAQQRKSMITVLKDLYIASYWDKTTKIGTPVKQRR